MTDPNLLAALYNDFYIFFRKAFASCHPTKTFRNYPYLEYLCYLAAEIEAGELTRLNLAIPPRHLKTSIFSKALPAWIFGRNPSKEIMILTCSEPLAQEIAYQIRAIMLMDWDKQAFRRVLRLIVRGSWTSQRQPAGFALPVRSEDPSLAA